MANDGFANPSPSSSSTYTIVYPNRTPYAIRWSELEATDYGWPSENYVAKAKAAHTRWIRFIRGLDIKPKLKNWVAYCKSGRRYTPRMRQCPPWQRARRKDPLHYSTHRQRTAFSHKPHRLIWA